MIDSTNQRFQRAAAAFLDRFKLDPGISPDPAYLKKLFRAFGQLPYENVSKIINYHKIDRPSSCSFRNPAQVIEGFLADFLAYTLAGAYVAGLLFNILE